MLGHVVAFVALATLIVVTIIGTCIEIRKEDKIPLPDFNPFMPFDDEPGNGEPH